MLREARRQVNEECRTLWRTRTSHIKEVTKGAKEMRLMGVRITKLLEPIQDARCDMCVSEGRFPKMSWSRFSSPDREDDMCIKDAYKGRSALLLREATARGTDAREFDETRLTKVLKEGDEVRLVQLWQDEGGPMWRQAQIPIKGGAGLIVMPVLMRTRRPSKVWPLEEEQSFTSGVGQSKTMDVVLSSPGQGRKREVVMVTDVVTGRQTIIMRVADGRSEKERQVGRNVCEETDGGEEEARKAKPGTGEQAETALNPESKGKAQ